MHLKRYIGYIQSETTKRKDKNVRDNKSKKEVKEKK